MALSTYDERTKVTATTTDKKLEVREAINSLVAWIDEANRAHTAKHYPSLTPNVFYVDGGRKYIRIAYGPVIGAGASVHCFIDAATGDVYKAASWKAPALNGARFNILDAGSLEDLKSKWDPYGSYLYKY